MPDTLQSCRARTVDRCIVCHCVTESLMLKADVA